MVSEGGGRRMVAGIVLVVGMVLLCGCAAGAGGVNETLAAGSNDGTMHLLMESSASRLTVDDCVRSVRRMRFGEEYRYPVSSPPLRFTPPGTFKWCNCLADDPSGILDMSRPSFGTPDAPKELFEAAFDRCRAEVLEGSTINTEDMCRGMLDLFGEGLGRNYVTFCGRICRTLELDYYYYGYAADGLNLYNGCGEKCSADTMPGYCAKYKVWYAAWKFGGNADFNSNTRRLGVGLTQTGVQSSRDFGKRARRGIARDTCTELAPLLGGNPNECCNYPRAFQALQACCALDDDGLATFDCDKNIGGSRNMYYECVTNSRLMGYFPGTYYNRRACSQFFNDAADLENLKVWKEKSSGRLMFTFQESDMENWCNENDQEGTCCQVMAEMNIAANCVDRSTLEYVGRTKDPLEGPSPAAPYDDPCLGFCEDGRECVMSNNNVPFCVDCTAFLKPERGSGDLLECCQYDAATKTCRTALKNSGTRLCKRSDEDIFVRRDDGTTQEAQFKGTTGFLCNRPREFKDNGAACKVVPKAAGGFKCVE